MGRKHPFTIDEYYHVYNRGTERRRIFLDVEDYSYFCHILDVFNDKKPVKNTRRNCLNERSRTSLKIEKERELLVEIVGSCLMPNHYHLILRQLMRGGISKFLQKIGTGYTNYFNKKYKRSGVLFQGRTKSRYVASDEDMQNLKKYVDLNPIDLIESNWKESGLQNPEKVFEFLKKYPWSSQKDYEIYRDEIFGKNE